MRGVALSLILSCAAAAQSKPELNKILQESARVTEADRTASSSFDYSETDLESHDSRKTYRVHMLLGTPYRELIAVNGKALPRQAAEQEKHKLQQEAERRKKESAEDRKKRLEAFQKEQSRDRRFLEEFVHAFTFRLLGEQTIDHRSVYVIEALPRGDYRPTDKASEVLTGMRGRLWIDKQTFQWVRVEADVIHPVSIEGFLATVEPGTRFELEKMPVEDNIWLARHFAMFSKARILSFIRHSDHEDETYFDYGKSDQP